MDINYHRNNFFLYPQALLRKRLEEDGVWAGWQNAQWGVYPADWYSYISNTWVPKLAPLVRINHGGLEVGGFNLQTHLRRIGGGPVSKFYFELHQRAKQIQQKAADLKEQMVPTKGPVPRTKKEEWVEKLMWDMGMARSKYKPEVKDLFPHMNVGTVGHIDYANTAFRQYLGRTVHIPPRGEDIINEIRKMMVTPEHCDVKPIGPQTIEEFQAYLRAFDPAKKEPTLAGLFLKHS